jgi:iduronate 2-sulfatase
MMVHIPGKTDKGIVTEKLVEFVDLFPTLVEAADFKPLPLCPEDSTKVGLYIGLRMNFTHSVYL